MLSHCRVHRLGAHFASPVDSQVNEMLDLLPADDILCGLVRMGFGAGKFRRTKYISIWWAG